MRKKATGEPSWRWRRTAIYVVTVWACFQLYLLIDANDTRVNETIAWGWQALIAILVLGYTGFATVQDVAAIWRTRSAMPYAESVDASLAPPHTAPLTGGESEPIGDAPAPHGRGEA